jgi:hypothetical protein
MTIGSRVKQGCVMSPTLFLIIINWIMKKVTDTRIGVCRPCVFTNREKPCEEGITKTEGRSPKNRLENKREEN